GSTQAIGLTSAPYEYTDTVGQVVRQNRPTFLNAAGDVAGTADRGSASGSDTWIWKAGVQAKLINLTGPAYEYTTSQGVTRTSVPLALTANGSVVGINTRYDNGQNRGRDVWYSASSQLGQVINLVGAEYEQSAGNVSLRSGTINSVSATGHVLGSSSRFGAGAGNDVWVYKTASGTQRVNLAGAGYEYNNGSALMREAEGAAINSAGAAIGDSTRFSQSGQRLGFDAWYSDPSGNPSRINLIGPNYEYTGPSGAIIRSGHAGQINDGNQVLGTSSRFDSAGNGLGTCAWFFDAATGITSPLEFSFSDTGICSTFPTLLTNDGVVLGTYNYYDNSNPVTSRVFWWSVEAGEHDLGTLVAGGLSNAGWQQLATVFNPTIPGAIGHTSEGTPYYIMGNGLTLDSSNGETVYMLSAIVPEPAAAGLVAFFCFHFLCVRRRPVLHA
ncbi:MAG: hypothetical protein H7Z14_08665, partial [Anaerolineae bacterium]|nr:hypothetical protein [Phycisphaerae bacterium]